MVPMADLISLALVALTVARLTRLVTTDRITEAPRNALIRRLDPDGLTAYLLVCSWCSSLYVSAGVVGAWYLWADQIWFTATTAVFAFSHIAGFLASREGE